MQFNKVIGQEKAKESLVTSVNSGRIPHAQLFYGPAGCGSLPLAIAYAQYIACTGRNEGDSCGVCSSCRKFEKLIHPDLHFAFPVNTSKDVGKDPVSDDYISKWRDILYENPYFSGSAWYNFIGLENKQGLISRNESEAIVRKLNLKSFESDYKFLIMWLPEKMNATAANMLLKLVEEPPEKTIFILVSEEPEEVLKTISSRTQPVKLTRLDNIAIEQALRERFKISEQESNTAARLANGNYIAACEILETSDENEFDLEMFTRFMRLSYARNIVELSGWVEDMASIGREKLKTFLTYSLRLIRENFILNLKDNSLVYLTPKEEQFSQKFHPYINGRNVIGIAEEFNTACADIERNANAKIVLFDMAMKIVKLIRK
jgi:DNA polymerase III subunit delta'